MTIETTLDTMNRNTLLAKGVITQAQLDDFDEARELERCRLARQASDSSLSAFLFQLGSEAMRAQAEGAK